MGVAESLRSSRAQSQPKDWPLLMLLADSKKTSEDLIHHKQNCRMSLLRPSNSVLYDHFAGGETEEQQDPYPSNKWEATLREIFGNRQIWA